MYYIYYTDTLCSAKYFVRTSFWIAFNAFGLWIFVLYNLNVFSLFSFRCATQTFVFAKSPFWSSWCSRSLHREKLIYWKCLFTYPWEWALKVAAQPLNDTYANNIDLPVMHCHYRMQEQIIHLTPIWESTPLQLHDCVLLNGWGAALKISTG